MDKAQLIADVTILRDRQRLYFSTRDSNLLMSCKDMETKIDDLILNCNLDWSNDFDDLVDDTVFLHFMIKLSRMRIAQIRFFSAVWYDRMKWLESAKKAEEEVDQCLVELSKGV